MISCLLLPSASVGEEAKPLVAQRADVNLQVVSSTGCGHADLSYVLKKDYSDLVFYVPKLITHRDATRQQVRVTQCHIHEANPLTGEQRSHSFELVKLDTNEYSTSMKSLPSYDEVQKKYKDIVSLHSGAHSCEDLLLHVGSQRAHTELNISLEFLLRFDSPSSTTTSVPGKLPPTTALQYVVLNKLLCMHLSYTLNLASSLQVEDVITVPSGASTTQLKWEFSTPSARNVVRITYKTISTTDDGMLSSDPISSGFSVLLASGVPSVCCTCILNDGITKSIHPAVHIPHVQASNALLGCDALMMVESTMNREQLPARLQNQPLFPSEYVFVVDCSGSMSGTNIQMAADTLITCIKSLPKGCYFNVIAFGSKFRHLFHTSTEYSRNSVERALQFANQLQASLGGTELLEPLRWIYKKPRCDELPRQIFIVTDGGVTNTQYVLHTVRKNRHLARCHTFGIGSDVCLELVTGIASASGGTSVVLKEGERLQTKVMEVLTKSLEPTVSDTVLRWNPPEGYTVVDSTPRNLNALYTGNTSMAYAFLRRTDSHSDAMAAARPPAGDATITGKVCGEQVEIPIHPSGLPSLTSQQSATLSSMLLQGALWSKLKDLEMQAFSSSRKNSQNDEKIQEPAAKRRRVNGLSHHTVPTSDSNKQSDISTQEELVKLSVESHIPCGLTHFKSQDSDRNMMQILPYKQSSLTSSKPTHGMHRVLSSKQSMHRRYDRIVRQRSHRLKAQNQLSVTSLAKSTVTAVGATLKSMLGVTFGVVCGDANQSMEIGQSIDDELEYQEKKDTRLYWDDSEGGQLVYPPMYYRTGDGSNKTNSTAKNKLKHKAVKRTPNGSTRSLNSLCDHSSLMSPPEPTSLDGITHGNGSHHTSSQPPLTTAMGCGCEDDDFTISDTESDSSVDPDWGDLRRPNELLPLIHMQLFSGAWPIVRAFSYAAGVPLEEIRRLPLTNIFIPSASQNIPLSSPNASNLETDQDFEDHKAHFWSTALALACFEEYFSHLRPEWELVALKGQTWLEQNCNRCPLSIVDVQQTAKELVLRQS